MLFSWSTFSVNLKEKYLSLSYMGSKQKKDEVSFYNVDTQKWICMNVFMRNMSLTMYIRRCSDIILDTSALRSSNSRTSISHYFYQCEETSWRMRSLMSALFLMIFCSEKMTSSGECSFPFWINTKCFVFRIFMEVLVSFVAFGDLKMLI